MSVQSTESSHPLLSGTDRIASSTTDLLLLVSRVFLGWFFLVSAWGKLGNIAGFTGYLTNLKAPAPEIMSWVGALVEFLIGIALILGVATRYAALLCVLFLIVATALAHRYWEYPPAQVAGQYANFLKNLAILGGALLVFVTGPGRYSIDRILSKKALDDPRLNDRARHEAYGYQTISLIGGFGLLISVFGLILGAIFPGPFAGAMLPAGLALLWLAQVHFRKALASSNLSNHGDAL